METSDASMSNAERIEDLDACRHEVGAIARDHGQTVHERRCGRSASVDSEATGTK